MQVQSLDVRAIGRTGLDVDQVEDVRREGTGVAGIRADGAVRAAELVDELEIPLTTIGMCIRT